MRQIDAVLFDLDGTLLDTAPDLAYALNQLRQAYRLPELPLSSIRSTISFGAAAILKHGFDIDEKHPDFKPLKEEYLALYAKHLTDSTRFFPNIEKVLSHLEQHDIPWGIVTNRMTNMTIALLKALGYEKRPGCIICGDTLRKNKPHPEPILEACRLLKQTPQRTIYVGDAATDVTASKAAGAKSLVALYGYIPSHENPESWKADGYINEPIEIIEWLEQYPPRG